MSPRAANAHEPYAHHTPSRTAEIDNQAAYLAEHASETVALQFLTALEATLAVLVERPSLGAAWSSGDPRLQGVRRHRVAGFPNHLLFYRYDERRLDVLHLYHGAQDIDRRLAESADDDETASDPRD